jgi:hypothetical protein
MRRDGTHGDAGIGSTDQRAKRRVHGDVVVIIRHPNIIQAINRYTGRTEDTKRQG